MKVKVINGGHQRMFAGVEQKDGVIVVTSTPHRWYMKYGFKRIVIGENEIFEVKDDDK